LFYRCNVGYGDWWVVQELFYRSFWSVIFGGFGIVKVGANDVVNPGALDDENSPIRIIVWRCKR